MSYEVYLNTKYMTRYLELDEYKKIKKGAVMDRKRWWWNKKILDQITPPRYFAYSQEKGLVVISDDTTATATLILQGLGGLERSPWNKAIEPQLFMLSHHAKNTFAKNGSTNSFETSFL